VPGVGAEDPKWLNQSKLASLGFDVSIPENTEQSRKDYQRLPSKQVFLVLEFNGKAYQRALENAGKLDAMEAKHGGHTSLETEQNELSRLFIIDAGLSREELRAKYPDSTHYAIIRGRVQLVVASESKLAGAVVTNSESIKVPLEFRSVFELQHEGYNAAAGHQYPYEVTLAFGKRLEPWIAAASEKKE
jgi:uncharacterized protein (DUF433 family)